MTNERIKYNANSANSVALFYIDRARASLDEAEAALANREMVLRSWGVAGSASQIEKGVAVWNACCLYDEEKPDVQERT